MMREGVDIAINFAEDTIKCELIGMNITLMRDYIRYVADRLLVELGYNKIYNASNPFDFMESIGFLSKDNFFEGRTDAYQKSHNENNTRNWKFKVMDDF